MEEKIVNKQIDVGTIIEIAKYLEEQKNEYIKYMNEDEEKNKELSYKEQVYQYKAMSQPFVQYDICFKDNKEIQQKDYDWFVQNLRDISKIKSIRIYFRVSYTDNTANKERWIHKSLTTTVSFHEERVNYKVDGTELEDEVYKQKEFILNQLQKCEDRYNKTIKNRNFRIQSFCLSIGFILSYIIYFVLNGMKGDLPEIIVSLLKNKYGLIFGQWFVAGVVGNIFGQAIMQGLYKNLLPKKKYSHYSASSKQSVYVDDINNYTNECEVQIGNNANNGKNREKIEKIHKVTSKIVLAQVLISVIMFLVIK